MHEASSAATSAAAAAGAPLDTNYMEPDPVTGFRREHVPPGPTVYVGNINFDTTEEQITKYLEPAGQILDVKIVKDARGFSRGWVSRAIEHTVGYVLTY